MSHSISIDITTFDLMDPNDIVGTSNVTEYNLTTWYEFVPSFIHALQAAGFHPNLEDMIGAMEQCFPSQDDSCCGCENNPANYEH